MDARHRVIDSTEASLPSVSILLGVILSAAAALCSCSGHALRFATDDCADGTPCLSDGEADVGPSTDAGVLDIVGDACDGGLSCIEDFATDANAHWITGDLNYLYWETPADTAYDGTTRSDVLRKPLRGGATTTLASFDRYATCPVVDDSGLFCILPTPVWPHDFPANVGAIAWVPIEGGIPQTLATGRSKPSGLVTNRDSIFWIDQDLPGGLFKMSKQGGTITTLVNGLSLGGFEGSLDADDSAVYYIREDLDHCAPYSCPLWALHTISADGGTPGLVTPASGSILLDGDTIYYLDLHALHKVPAAGGPSTMLFPTGRLFDGNGLAQDTLALYWWDGDFTLRRLDKASSEVSTLASGPELDYRGWTIYAGDRYIYWITKLGHVYGHLK